MEVKGKRKKRRKRERGRQNEDGKGKKKRKRERERREEVNKGKKKKRTRKSKKWKERGTGMGGGTLPTKPSPAARSGEGILAAIHSVGKAIGVLLSVRLQVPACPFGGSARSCFRTVHGNGLRDRSDALAAINLENKNGFLAAAALSLTL